LLLLLLALLAWVPLPRFFWCVYERDAREAVLIF
jgi:hypothetical protein